VFGGALLLGLAIYAPAFRGDFVFDDFGLPMHLVYRAEPLTFWLSGVRPVLLLS
jgi:hypothetical protein